MSHAKPCNYVVQKNPNACSPLLADVNGDGFRDVVRVCREAELRWEGDENVCRKQFAEIVPDMLDRFSGGKGVFKTRELAIKYRKDHRSIRELQDDLFRRSGAAKSGN